ncbi:hypothetical protein YPPY16_2638, partial [Yersinia pestis PY-16]
MGCTFITIQ